jgi:alanyl-tRNA synthetase
MIGEYVGLVLDRTNFYAEQGGQVGDTGSIADKFLFTVEDTQRLGDSIIHWGIVEAGMIVIGEEAMLKVHPARLDIMRNHTATHLMNWALREVLGEHVEQKGSLVDAEKTRFDFTHDKPMTHDEIAMVERLVNEKILGDLPVTAINQHLADAKKIPGVRAVFGEKYPDPVRVVTIGTDPFSRDSKGSSETSVEFCGGTHLTRTSQACLFKIVSQEGVAKGVRRITAVTGPKAVEYDRQLSSVVGELSERFHCRPEELPTRIESLQEEIKKLQQQLKKGASSDLAGTMDKLLASATKAGDVTLVIGEIPAGPDDAIRTQVDRVKQKAGSAVVVVGWSDDGKVGLLAAVTDDIVKRGVKAGDLIKQIAPIVGGGGGGRPNMAQAGGKDPAKLGDALAKARQTVEQQLAK